MRFNKLKKVAALALFILATACLAIGCSSGGKNYKDGVKVTYVLNGGTCGNSGNDLVHYYSFEKGTTNLIVDPSNDKVFGKDKIKKAGNVYLEGWYKDADFTQKWDFTKDKVGDEGITLYCRWKPNVVNRFNICYLDENGNSQMISKDSFYTDVFGEDYKGFGDSRPGYTAIGGYYVFKDGQFLLDENGDKIPGVRYVFPESEEDQSVDLIVDYIVGEYKFITKASDVNTNQRGGAAMIMNDIDFGGKTIDLKKFKGVVGNVEANGGQVPVLKNFRVSFSGGSKKSLSCSLFGDASDIEIKNVRFENVVFELKSTRTVETVEIAPLCSNATDVTIENVSFQGSVEPFGGVVPDALKNGGISIKLEPCFKGEGISSSGFTAEIEDKITSKNSTDND